tara:strand:+ start:20303 stop:20962 length:660 start_codon:yes stop_codon:yes gene_type:complete
MGKTVKTIGAIAAIGTAAYFTGGAALAGFGGASSAGGISGTLFGVGSGSAFGAGTVVGAGSSTVGLIGSGGSFGLGGSLFTLSNAKTLFSGISAISDIAGGFQDRNTALTAAQLEQRRKDLALIQAKQLEANAIENGNRARSSAIAQAGSQGLDVSGRSFLAFAQDQEKEVKDERSTIRVNAESGLTSSNLRIRSLRSQATQSTVSGFVDAGRTLFKFA